jgi:hypothetical protein
MAAASAMRPATIDVIAPPAPVPFGPRLSIARNAGVVDPGTAGRSASAPPPRRRRRSGSRSCNATRYGNFFEQAFGGLALVAAARS